VTPLTILLLNFDPEINNNLKKNKEQKMNNLTLTLVLAITLSLTTVNAQNSGLILKKNEIQNLISGIQSDNTGLRKSAIFMAGKYEVMQTEEALITLLKIEEDASVKILIALALYKIGSDKGMEAVENLAENDRDKEVRRMSTAILNQWEADNQVIVNR
jgi:HEAT repeat protein